VGDSRSVARWIEIGEANRRDASQSSLSVEPAMPGLVRLHELSNQSNGDDVGVSIRHHMLGNARAMAGQRELPGIYCTMPLSPAELPDEITRV